MNDNARAFLEAAQADPELRERLSSMDAGELVAAARERGFELSEEDFGLAAGELDEADLENVAGGLDCSCVAYGLIHGVSTTPLFIRCSCYPAGFGTDD